MAFDRQSLDDYVEVNERIIEFYEKYPDGAIQTEKDEHIHGGWVDVERKDKYGKTFIVRQRTDGLIAMKAYAYRHPADPLPATGHSWLEIPGGTPYTRGSEMENAETSAVGRALAMLGIKVKRSIASAEEVANKRPVIMPDDAGRPNDVVNPYPHRLRRGIDDGAPKDPSGLVTVPDRVPPPESAIAKTLTPAQAEMMLKMLKLSADAGHNIGTWMAVWGLPTDGAEQLAKSPSVEGNVYAALTRMSQEKGQERFLKARDHYVPKDKREGLVWPT